MRSNPIPAASNYTIRRGNLSRYAWFYELWHVKNILFTILLECKMSKTVWTNGSTQEWRCIERNHGWDQREVLKQINIWESQYSCSRLIDLLSLNILELNLTFKNNFMLKQNRKQSSNYRVSKHKRTGLQYQKYWEHRQDSRWLS